MGGEIGILWVKGPVQICLVIRLVLRKAANNLYCLIKTISNVSELLAMISKCRFSPII